jgi:hypothetical protein
MQKWEYRFVMLDRGSEEAQLNHLGAEGWELVAVDMTTMCYLKRPLSAQEYSHPEK